MTKQDLILQVVSGGLLGMLGQTVRVCGGIKKISDLAAVNNQQVSDLFDGGRLLTSLLIGFAAGALAMVVSDTQGVATNLSNSLIAAVVSAGYAGTDFIEAWAKRFLPGSTTGQSSSEVANQAKDEVQIPPMG